MRFVVKDLMITVLPVVFDDLEAVPPSCDGGACSCCTGCTANTNQTHGTPCTPGCPAVALEASLDQLAAVKEQLRASLAEVERREAAVIESLRPRSPEEVETARRYLSEALDELTGGQDGGEGGGPAGAGEAR